MAVDESQDVPAIQKGSRQSLETDTGGIWIPEKVKVDLNAFKAHVLAQESADQRICFVSAALTNTKGFSGSLRKKLGTLCSSLGSSEGGPEPLGSVKGGRRECRRLPLEETKEGKGQRTLHLTTCLQTIGHAGLEKLSQAYHSRWTLS